MELNQLSSWTEDHPAAGRSTEPGGDPRAQGWTPTAPPATPPAPARSPGSCRPLAGWRRSPASARTWPRRSSPAGLDMTGSHRRAPGLLGRAMPGREPVRAAHRPRQKETRQRLPARRPRPGRPRRRAYRHLSRRTIPPRARRRGKAKPGHPGRSILIIIWHLPPTLQALHRPRPGPTSTHQEADKRSATTSARTRAMGLELTIMPGRLTLTLISDARPASGPLPRAHLVSYFPERPKRIRRAHKTSRRPYRPYAPSHLPGHPAPGSTTR